MVVNPYQMLDMIMALPEDKQQKAKDYIGKLIVEWDPDFVKLTPAEERELKKALEDNDYIKAEDINWDEEHYADLMLMLSVKALLEENEIDKAKELIDNIIYELKRDIDIENQEIYKAVLEAERKQKLFENKTCEFNE